MTRDDARRGNLREHGEPERGVYFGRDPRRPIGNGLLVSIAREARAVRLRDGDGNSIAAFGDTAKFWLAAAPNGPAQAAQAAGPAAQTLPPQAAPPRAEQAATGKAGRTAVDELAACTTELATSYRLTAEAITAAGATPVPVRQTWADAGHPATFLYYERGIQPRRPILATTTDGYRIHDIRTAQLIAHFASPVKMWIADPPRAVAPAPEPERRTPRASQWGARPLNS